MAQKPDGKSSKVDRVTFTRGAAERIGKVVREVEAGSRDLGPLEWGPRGGGGSKTFRVGTFTGSWPIGTTKTVTLTHGSGTTEIEATNRTCSLVATSACNCAIAKDGATWYLVTFDLTKLPGYAASETRLLSVQNGSLAWLGTTACT